MRRYAMSLVRDSDMADDLVQETFIRVMAHLELLGQLNKHQRRAWLHRVLKNLFLDEQRTHHRQQALVERLSREVQFASHPTPDMLPHEIFNLVPERYRELLHQRYVLGMTSQEIGKAFGIPAATVRSRLFLARKWLRANQSKFR